LQNAKMLPIKQSDYLKSVIKILLLTSVKNVNFFCSCHKNSLKCRELVCTNKQ
jgi:hypothetical protein